MERRCKQCKRPLRATDDDYCSTKCAKIAYGVTSPEQAKQNAKTHRKVLRDQQKAGDASVRFANPHTNRESHLGKGPTVRRQVRRRG